MRKKLLAVYHPELISEWSPKNDPVDIMTVGSGYHDKYWWICSRGHEWQASPGSRVAGHGCPYCAGNRIWAGEKDLALTHPHIAAQWDPGNLLKPTEITARSHRRVGWICPRCGYHYEMQVVWRTTKGGDCPLCKDGHAYTGSMDILTAKPELAAKWDYECNRRDASTYAAGSRFLVWWKDSCGHSYRAVIRDMYRGMPCPICERRKESNIPEKALIYYLKRMEIRYETNHQEITGLPLEIFLPDDRAAIECWEESQETNCAYARERCKNIACIQAGIKMIRILPRKARTYDNCLCILRKDKSIKSLEQAIAVSLRAIGIYNKTVDINLARDMEMVKIIPFERMLLKEYDRS